MSWMLVIYIYAGVWAKGDSVALQTVPMATEKACRDAGEQLSPLVSGSTKEVRYVCLKTGG